MILVSVFSNLHQFVCYAGCLTIRILRSQHEFWMCCRLAKNNRSKLFDSQDGLAIRQQMGHASSEMTSLYTGEIPVEQVQKQFQLDSNGAAVAA
jgi:hypothetical protein